MCSVAMSMTTPLLCVCTAHSYTIWRRKGQGEVAALRESKVGSKVSDYMTRRVIFIVLLMLLCVPIFQYVIAPIRQPKEA